MLETLWGRQGLKVQRLFPLSFRRRRPHWQFHRYAFWSMLQCLEQDLRQFSVGMFAWFYIWDLDGRMVSFVRPSHLQICMMARVTWSVSCTTIRMLDDRNMQRDFCRQLATYRVFLVWIGLHPGYGDGVMRAWWQDQGWAQIPLEPSQATTWLREMLRNFAPMSNPMDIGTHSLKATWLSILAKAGCDGDLRRLAGYHTDPSAKMALEYSRDAQAPVLMAMDAAATAMTHGLFDPDVSRAKRWPRKGCNSLQAVMQFLAHMDAEDFWYQNQSASIDPDLNQTDDGQEGFDFFGPPSEPYSPSHSDGSHSEAESISSISELSEKPLHRDLVSSDEEREAEFAAPIVGEELALALAQDIETEVFRHVISGCCHIARNASTDPDDGEAILLKCGKLATKNFEKVPLAGNFLPYKCSRCFTGSWFENLLTCFARAFEFVLSEVIWSTSCFTLFLECSSSRRAWNSVFGQAHVVNIFISCLLPSVRAGCDYSRKRVTREGCSEFPGTTGGWLFWTPLSLSKMVALFRVPRLIWNNDCCMSDVEPCMPCLRETQKAAAADVQQ